MSMNFKHGIYSALIFLSFFGFRAARADGDYNIGNPQLQQIWVDPVNGKDAPNRGSVRSLALQSVQVALANIPQNQPLNNTGFVIMLVPGVYPPDKVPPEFLSVLGTADYPVIMQAADDTGTVYLPSMDVTACKYFYMIGIHVVHTSGSGGSYGISFRGCDHILVRNCVVVGADSTSSDTALTGIIFDVCQNVYVEKSEISIVERIPLISPSGNAIDFYAAQYGHVKQCVIHDFGGNGVLVRGGSAYLTVEENIVRYGGLGGIRLGIRDTLHGLDDMTLPWVHYDCYDVKCFNNVIHHTADAALTCGGGYNILFAFNTMYETGLQSSLIVLNQTRRSRAIDKPTAQDYMDSGAWGTWYLDRGDDSDSAPIPNKNIFIYNNIFANPDDSATSGPHFSIAGPYTTPSFNAACPRPALADDNVQIRGNIIWNGTPQKPLGINGSSGCQLGNPNCNESQINIDNTINLTQVFFIDTANAVFRPQAASIVFTTTKVFKIPDFSWSGLPPSPVEPQGTTSNAVSLDIDSNVRKANAPIAGAYTISTSSVEPNALNEITTLENYPNPLNSETTIAFHLQNRSYVKLEIYNLLGEKTSSLLSATLDEGDHSLSWNANSVEAGTYFCRLSAGSEVMTKRMTVVK